MNVLCFDTQSDLKIYSSQVQTLVRILLEMKQVECDEVILHFVDSQTISSLHRDYFNDPTPTDCISFPIDSPSEPAEGSHILGEIFVCPAVAKSYAKKHNLDPYHEVCLYIVHGILHLLGYDDQEEKEKKRMRAEEKRCMCYLEEKKGYLTA